MGKSCASCRKRAFGRFDREEEQYNLLSVTVPDSITTIGDCAFEYCNSLTDIYYIGTEEQWKQISINSSIANLTNAKRHYVFADCNGDRETDVTDMACLFNYLATGENEGELDGLALIAAADVNNDGEVNILDYQALYEQLQKAPQ